MSRLVGTGKDPRYGKGEVFDVPKYAATAITGGADTGADEREINPAYQELLDRGLAKELPPEKDPHSTTTQIADHLVATGGALPEDPVQAKLADDIGHHDAYAITHTGDASAKASATLKPKAVEKLQRTDRQQRGADTLSESVTEEKAPAAARTAANAGGGDKGDKGGS